MQAEDLWCFGCFLRERGKSHRFAILMGNDKAMPGLKLFFQGAHAVKQLQHVFNLRWLEDACVGDRPNAVCHIPYVRNIITACFADL